jgi:ABC-type Mn2+/Zn2+ transport system permease subunit
MVMGNRRPGMNNHMELSRPNWNAAIKLAVVLSIVAGFAAVVASAASDVPQSAIVLSVIVVGFTASWIQSSRLRREHG